MEEICKGGLLGEEGIKIYLSHIDQGHVVSPIVKQLGCLSFLLSLEDLFS